MAGSKGRVLHPNHNTGPPQGAKMVPFGRRETMQEGIANTLAFQLAKPRKGAEPMETQHEGSKLIKLESARESKAKGGFRKAAELPNEHYVVAWIVWYCYVHIMLSSGLRVEESVKRLEYNQPLKRAA